MLSSIFFTHTSREFWFFWPTAIAAIVGCNILVFHIDNQPANWLLATVVVASAMILAGITAQGFDAPQTRRVGQILMLLGLAIIASCIRQRLSNDVNLTADMILIVGVQYHLATMTYSLCRHSRHQRQPDRQLVS